MIHRKNFELFFHSNGTVTLQTDSYCRCFKKPKRAAYVVAEILVNGSPPLVPWIDNNDPKIRLQCNYEDIKNGEYTHLNLDDLLEPSNSLLHEFLLHTDFYLELHNLLALKGWILEPLFAPEILLNDLNKEPQT